MLNNILIILLVILNIIPFIQLQSQEKNFPREGVIKSEFFDGPYVLYDDNLTTIINTVEENGCMVINSKSIDTAELDSVLVYKSGFMPRRFSVKLKKEFEIETCNYPMPDKIFALSDIEGNFNTCINLLQQHNVLDENLNWSFGSGHLVVIGDVFDRGNHQTELLWLLYRLEKEAKKIGGYLHFILGNHELMNLRGDIRYINKKYFVMDSLVTKTMGIKYKNLYGKNSELGRWLRTKNAIEKIGNIIFVHAGLSPKLMKSNLSITDINDNVRKNLDRNKNEYETIDSLIMKRNGPLWYRGYFGDEDYELSTEEDVKNILSHFDTDYIVVGHTRFKKPTSFFSGSIRAINVNPPQDHNYTIPTRQCFGIIIQNEIFFIADDNGYIEKF